MTDMNQVLRETIQQWAEHWALERFWGLTKAQKTVARFLGYNPYGMFIQIPIDATVYYSLVAVDDNN